MAKELFYARIMKYEHIKRTAFIHFIVCYTLHSPFPLIYQYHIKLFIYPYLCRNILETHLDQCQLVKLTIDLKENRTIIAVVENQTKIVPHMPSIKQFSCQDSPLQIKTSNNNKTTLSTTSSYMLADKRRLLLKSKMAKASLLFRYFV